jgi:predicted component of type VI protein secretion system
MTVTFFILAFLCTIGCVAQKKVAAEPLHHITIYKWAKDAQGNENEVILNFFVGDSVNVTTRTDGEPVNVTKKIKIGDFEKGFFKFINGEKIVKTPAYTEEEMGSATSPEDNQQVLHITIVTLKDNDQVGKKDYPAEYFKIITADFKDEKPDTLFKYFKKKEAETLKSLLNN